MPATFAMHGLSLAIGARAVQKLAALESSDEPAQYAERGRRILRLDVSTLSAAMMAAQVLMWKGRVHWHGALTIGFCMGLKMLCEQSFHVGDMKHVTTRYTLRELLAGENRACELLLGANRCGITPCSPLRHVNIFRSMLCSAPCCWSGLRPLGRGIGNWPYRVPLHTEGAVPIPLGSPAPRTATL